MTNSERAVAPRRKVESWLQHLDVAERTCEEATRVATESCMTATHMEETRISAVRMAAAARSAGPRVAAIPVAPGSVAPTRTAPSPVEATFAQDMEPSHNPPESSHSFNFCPCQTAPYGNPLFPITVTPFPQLTGTPGPSQSLHVSQHQITFHQQHAVYNLSSGTHPFYQGASSSQNMPLQATAPQSPWPLGYTPVDADPNAEVSPAVVSGPMTTERLRQEVHEADISYSQVPGYQYTSEGKVQKRSGYSRRTSTGAYRLTCERCRVKHDACNTGKPNCSGCIRAGVPCVYTKKKRTGPPRRRGPARALAPAPPPALAFANPPTMQLQAPVQEDGFIDLMDMNVEEENLDPVLRDQ